MEFFSRENFLVPQELGGPLDPLQYSCLENPMDRGTWLATVRGVTKSQTRLSGSARMHRIGETGEHGLRAPRTRDFGANTTNGVFPSQHWGRKT